MAAHATLQRVTRNDRNEGAQPPSPFRCVVLYGLKLIRETHGVREYLVKDKKLRKLLFPDSHVSAWYVEGAIYYSTKKASQDKRVRRHELEHARQEQQLGRATYQTLYRWSQTIFGYRCCPFEMLARLKERK